MLKIGDMRRTTPDDPSFVPDLSGGFHDMNAQAILPSLDRVAAQARAHAAAGRFDACAALCAQGLDWFETMPQPAKNALSAAVSLYLLGANAAEHRGDLAVARRLLRRAARISPSRSETWGALSRVCMKLYRATGEAVLADESAGARRNARLLERAPEGGVSRAGFVGQGA